MNVRKIHGQFMSKHDAHTSLHLFMSIRRRINFALEADNCYHFACHENTVWSIMTEPKSTMQAEKILRKKCTIASGFIAFIEEWKVFQNSPFRISSSPSLKYRTVSQNELWNLLVQKQYVCYLREVRNWLAHCFCNSVSEIREENEYFRVILEAYREMRPVVEDLVLMLEASLADEETLAPQNCIRLILKKPSKWIEVVPTNKLDIEDEEVSKVKRRSKRKSRTCSPINGVKRSVEDAEGKFDSPPSKRAKVVVKEEPKETPQGLPMRGIKRRKKSKSRSAERVEAIKCSPIETIETAIEEKPLIFDLVQLEKVIKERESVGIFGAFLRDTRRVFRRWGRVGLRVLW